MTVSNPQGTTKGRHLLLPMRSWTGPAQGQGRGWRRHRRRTQLRRRGRAPRSGPGLREGLRPRAEDLQPEPRPAADEAHQPEEGAPRGPRLRADLLGRGARHHRREAAQESARPACSTPRAIRGSPPASAAAGPPTAYMGTFPAFLAAWGPGGHELRQRPRRQVLPLRASLRRVVAPRLHRLSRHAAQQVHPVLRQQHRGLGRRVRRLAPRRRRASSRASSACRSSRTCPSPAAAPPSGYRSSPKTDAACMHALIHVMLFENARSRLDIDFLKHRTASPYLVAPNGFYLRDPDTRKPLVWDLKAGMAVVFDTPGIDPALDGDFIASGLEVLPDEELVTHDGIAVRSAFGKLLDHERTLQRPSGRRASATCRRRPSAASPTNTSTTPRSAPRSRSRAAPCPTARWRSRSARR